jgi:2-(1,2-epoxy-1,2-dihydrophenyl)acetyl-CoA isomerase
MSGVTIRDQEHVRVVALSRPERRNALNLEDRLELRDALLTKPANIRAMVITGGDFFCSGGDISSMSPDPAVAHERLSVINSVVRVIVGGDVPVVAAVEGGAYGLGFGLAMACDFVIAGESASFAASFARLGLGPDTGLSYTLPSRIGRARTRDLLLTARVIKSPEAANLGVVDEVVADGTATEVAVARAESLARLSLPMLQEVRSLLQQPDQTLEAMLEGEARAQVRLLESVEFQEGRAAFLQRRRPNSTP